MFQRQFFASNYFSPSWWSGVSAQTTQGGKLLLALHGTGGAGSVARQDGKSGYWRLFYHNMQAEANEKRKKKYDQKPEQQTAEVIQLPKKRAHKIAVPKHEEVLTNPEIEFSKPLVLRPSEPDYRPQYLQDMWQITLELRRYVIESPTITVSILKEPSYYNDDEEVFLLLAA